MESVSKEVMIEEGRVALPGYLVLPAGCKGLVLFAHGSGSSRLSPRNLQVAKVLNKAGLGTLLFDLLSEEESDDRTNVFDIPLLARRLELATRWARSWKELESLPFGYFGASTGGGAALWAAADLGNKIAAVVSRGGRPDLAIPRLSEVTAESLLLVGGDDDQVIEMNREALKHLSRGKLVIIAGASHLFEEPGTLEAVADHARGWFTRCFEQAGGERRVA